MEVKAGKARFPLSYVAQDIKAILDDRAAADGVSTAHYVLSLIEEALGKTPTPKKEKKQKRESRPQAWSRAASEAGAALDELVSLQEEYQGWLDNMPEGLQQSPTGQKPEEVCNIDLSSARDAVGEAEDMNLPRGFGND